LLLLTAGISAPAIGSLGRNDTEMKEQASDSQRSTTIESRTLSVRIDQPIAKVYEFLVDPAKWNKWAFGLGKSLRRSDGGWIADSDGGLLKVRFTARNQRWAVPNSTALLEVIR